MSVIQPNPLAQSTPPHILSLLDRLHALSLEQESKLDITRLPADTIHDATRDKFIALDQDKCQFVYTLARAIDAHNIIEAGTSFGVSTIYLGLAVSHNIESSAASRGDGVVIATEHEPSKAEQARKHWAAAGEIVERHIELREGDILKTLSKNLPLIDLVLIDIWAPLTLPILKLVQPRLRRGAVVIVDNSIGSATRYKDLLEYLRADDSGFLNLTLPYDKGLEVSIYTPKA